MTRKWFGHTDATELMLVAAVVLLIAALWRDRPEPPAPRPTLAQCEVVYADSYDIRAAAESGELDVFDALLLEPGYQTMILEAYETTFSPKTFSARWLGMCLAGRITPREVD